MKDDASDALFYFLKELDNKKEEINNEYYSTKISSSQEQSESSDLFEKFEQNNKNIFFGDKKSGSFFDSKGSNISIITPQYGSSLSSDKEKSNNSKINIIEIPLYYICVKKFLKEIFSVLSIPPNAKQYPDVTKFKYIDLNKLEEQKEFLSQIHKENGNYYMLKKSENYDEQILKMIKQLIAPDIETQNAKDKVNIFNQIKNNSSFSLTMYPHRYINNENNNLKNAISTIMKCGFNRNADFDEDRNFIVLDGYINKRIYKNIYNIKDSEISNILNIFAIHDFKIYLKEYCGIKESNLDPKYDFPFCIENRKVNIKGEECYHPNGWFGIDLNVKNNLDWPFAYFTFNKEYTNEQMKDYLRLIIEKNNQAFEDQDIKYNDEKTSKPIGKGICFLPKIKNAEALTNSIEINNKKYKLLLMVIVDNEKIKKPKNDKIRLWVVEKEFIKIIRIILKEETKSESNN